MAPPPPPLIHYSYSRLSCKMPTKYIYIQKILTMRFTTYLILMKQKLYFLNVVKKMYLMIVSDDQQDYQESEICSQNYLA